MLLHVQTRRSASLDEQPRSTSWKNVGKSASPQRGWPEADWKP